MSLIYKGPALEGSTHICKELLQIATMKLIPKKYCFYAIVCFTMQVKYILSLSSEIYQNDVKLNYILTLPTINLSVNEIDFYWVVYHFYIPS